MCAREHSRVLCYRTRAAACSRFLGFSKCYSEARALSQIPTHESHCFAIKPTEHTLRWGKTQRSSKTASGVFTPRERKMEKKSQAHVRKRQKEIGVFLLGVLEGCMRLCTHGITACKVSRPNVGPYVFVWIHGAARAFA
jgi:hypothetical protein